jgi:hypothetical protein
MSLTNPLSDFLRLQLDFYWHGSVVDGDFGKLERMSFSTFHGHLSASNPQQRVHPGIAGTQNADCDCQSRIAIAC